MSNMIIVKEAKKEMLIEEDGMYEILLEADEMKSFKLDIAKNTNASLFITYKGKSAEIVNEICLHENAQVNMLFWNEISETAKIHESVYVEKDANVKVAYGELSEANGEYDITYHLNASGANVNISSACIASVKKHYEVKCIHHAPYTTGIMENYCVVREHGDYKMIDTGKIERGAYGSESHQKTRVLTMSENQTSNVTPLLLIDENDVQASHATTLGQPDANQLYYLQTRGLTKEQAMGLLTIGYLMPITKTIQNETLQNRLIEEIEAKVGAIC